MGSRVVRTTRVTTSGSTFVEVITYSVGDVGRTYATVGTRTVSTITSSRDTTSRPPPSSSPNSRVNGGGGSSTTGGLSDNPSGISSAAAGTTGSPSAVSSSDSGISTGALAGAAVGCLIGGALIAFLLALFIFKKREQRKYDSGGYYQSSDSSSQNRDVVAVAEKPAPKAAGAVMAWQAYLPQSADDRTIQNGAKTFFDMIELHVDNFYRKTPVELGKETREALAQIDSGKLPGRIDQLMQDQRLVLPVIKHCIADLLITRMSPLAYPETSLLPSYLSAIPTKLQSNSLSSNERSAANQAYSQWRLLNAYLYPKPLEDQVYIDDREAKANDIVELLSKAFAPWQMQDGDKSEMHEHEKGLVATAGNLGILLMSQPSAFEFKWTADSGRTNSGRSLIALPAFWKSTDEQGRLLSQPQLLVSPLIVRV